MAAEIDDELEKIKNTSRFQGTDTGEDTRNGGAVQFEGLEYFIFNARGIHCNSYYYEFVYIALTDSMCTYMCVKCNYILRIRM